MITYPNDTLRDYEERISYLENLVVMMYAALADHDLLPWWAKIIPFSEDAPTFNDVDPKRHPITL